MLSEYEIAKRFVNKYSNAKDRGIEFNLNMTSFRNVFKAKKCYFTDLPLTNKTISIDRVDARKGYVKGNVVACHTAVNSFKGTLENGDCIMDIDTAKKLIKRWEKRL